MFTFFHTGSDFNIYDLAIPEKEIAFNKKIILNNFIYNPDKIKSNYLKTLFIVCRHIFIYEITLNILIAFLSFSYLYLINSHIEEENRLMLHLSFIILVILGSFIIIKFIINKFNNNTDNNYHFKQFILSIETAISLIIHWQLSKSLTGDKYLLNLTRFQKNLKKILIFIFSVLALNILLNMTFALSDSYKKHWGLKIDPKSEEDNDIRNFIFKPENIKSKYWQTMFIILRHIFIYQFLLNMFLIIMFLIFKKIFYHVLNIQKNSNITNQTNSENDGLNLEESTTVNIGKKKDDASLKYIKHIIIFVLLLVTINFATVKFSIDKFNNWFMILILILNIFIFSVFHILFFLNMLMGQGPTEAIVKMLLFVLLLIFELILIIPVFSNRYKALWGVI